MMNAISEDFWPADIVMDVPVSPVNILRAQASKIGEKTKNIVEGRVRTSSYLGELVHSFELVAPALGNYSHELFVVTHPVTLYPVKVAGDYLETEEELIKWLKAKLASPETKRIVGSLLAQSS
jgi:hypothetical protein